jgi:hypothetical protein
VFWWRDDDARRPGPALNRLLHLSRRFEAPLTLAAVPDGDMAALVEACAAIRTSTWRSMASATRTARRPASPRARSMTCDTLDDISAEVETAIAAFARAGLTPDLFVPPWNNAHATLDACPGAARPDGVTLRRDRAPGARTAPGRSSGHHALEARSRAFAGACGSCCGRGACWSSAAFAGYGMSRLGLLTHHLDHDEASWRFLAAFLSTFKPVSRRGL